MKAVRMHGFGGVEVLRFEEVPRPADAPGGIGRFSVGDPVIAFLPLLVAGAAAEYALVPADVLGPAPTSVR
jgi:NADPH:quinone reductase-like Zn-dependent oxidoreductase